MRQHSNWPYSSRCRGPAVTDMCPLLPCPLFVLPAPALPCRHHQLPCLQPSGARPAGCRQLQQEHGPV